MRLPDWEERLADFIAAGQTRAFEWGAWDCVLMATACAAAITGEDKAAAFRGAYTTRRGAARILRTLGQGTLLRTVNHNFAPKSPAYARRGDLIWHRGAVGVCIGKAAAFITDPARMDAIGAPRLGNFVLLPRADWQRAWGV